MTDNQLFLLLLPIISNGLIARGYSNFVVRQSEAPVQYGAEIVQAVYITKVHDHGYGFLGRKDAWNAVGGHMDHIESQQYETQFQIEAWVTQDPSNITLPTASDLLNDVAMVLRSDTTVFILKTNNVGILRIENCTNPYIVNDENRHSAIPRLEFTLTHRREFTSIIADTTVIVPNIHEI